MFLTATRGRARGLLRDAEASGWGSRPALSPAALGPSSEPRLHDPQPPGTAPRHRPPSWPGRRGGRRDGAYARRRSRPRLQTPQHVTGASWPRARAHIHAPYFAHAQAAPAW